MGIGLIVTIVMLGALFGLCARQAIEIEPSGEPVATGTSSPTPSESQSTVG
jgi:hypothetical protein